MPHPLFARADTWFARSQTALLGQLPCRRGCCRCCVGPFAVTALDADELQRGLSRLEPAVRTEIEARARRQVAAMEAATPRLRSSPWLQAGQEAELDALVERFAEEPCPALGVDGSCQVYASRPLTCRLMGIPVEADGITEGACAVQTAVPIVPLPARLRREEDALATAEAEALDDMEVGDAELLLPYAFLPETRGRRALSRAG